MKASIEVLIILLLILLNGALAMAEIAIVSARKVRLEQRARSGDAGARAALELAQKPAHFLSTVQIGITLIGILAGAFGGATISEEIAAALEKTPVLKPYAEGIAVALVVVVLTFLSLILGELAPKQIALSNPERTAARMAPLMQRLSRLAAPLVNLLSLVTNALLRLLHVKPGLEPSVTEEELKILLEQGTRAGVFNPIEENMIERIFRLGDLRASALITPRTEIDWLDTDSRPEKIRQQIIESKRSYFPVAQDSLDNLEGYVHSSDLLAQALQGQDFDLHAVLRTPLLVPESMSAFLLLERMRLDRVDIAFILDEYGGIQGMVTTSDLLQAIVGEMPAASQTLDPSVVQRADGSWLLDGMLLVEEFKDVLGLTELPGESENLYETLGGFVVTMLGRIPISGDAFDLDQYHFEVVDMDARRVDKVSVTLREP